MRALLIAPYVFVPPSWIPYYPQEPLGLEYLRVASGSHNVDILDCIGHYPHQYQGVPDGRILVGATVAQVQAELDRRRPELVGITFPFTTQVEPVRELVALAGANGITTVVGGSAAGFMDAGADIVVKGEGELPWRAILDGNYSEPTETDIIFQPVDEIPHPRRLLLDKYSSGLLNDTPLTDKVRILGAWLRYNRHNAGAMLFSSRSRSPANHASILTSRGCPFRCVYCATQNIWRRRYRARAMDDVLKEVEELRECGVRTINILDDTFNLTESRVRQFCQGILNLNMKVELRAASGLRPARLTMETLKLMKQAGFRELWFGIESGNQRVLDQVIRKETSLLEIRKILWDCRQVGIKTGGYFIVGMPGESVGDMWETIVFAGQFCDRVRLYICQPIPGSDLYDSAVENGWLTGDYDPTLAMIFGSRSYLSTPEFKPQEVESVAAAGRKWLRERGKLDHR